MKQLREEKLDFWISNNLNVLFIGHKGVGKSSRVLKAFEKHNLNYKYFSAPTMDPWVDFLGVPKEQQDETGPYLELIKPKEFRDDEIEAIFMDEFNRAHKKVKNALMELIQFKSINGKKFENLKIVWAAINPSEDGKYDVDQMDEAQEDRFEIHVHMPYEPSQEWFVDKFGDKIGKAAVEWWGDLSDDMKEKVSPRRLEYAMNMYNLKGGDVRDVLPAGCNINKLITTINTGPVSEKLKTLYKNKCKKDAQKFLSVENNYAASLKYLISPQDLKVDIKKWLDFFMPCLPSEKLSSLFASDQTVTDFILSNHEDYENMINEIVEANKNKKLIKRIKRFIGNENIVMASIGKIKNENYTKPKSGKVKVADWDKEMDALEKLPMANTNQRLKIYKEIADKVPSEMTFRQSLRTLNLINSTVGRCWPHKLKDLPEPLMPVLNHCLEQLYKKSDQDWPNLLKKYSLKFQTLIRNVVKAKWKSKIYTP